LDGIFVEAEAEAADDAQNVYRAVALHDRFKNDRSLVPGFPRLFGILRLDSREHRWRSHAAAHSEGAAACPTAFAGTDAGTFAFTHATTLAGSDTAADTGSRGRRAGNAVRITKVQQIDLGKLRELRSNNCRLDDQLRIGILRRLRIRR